MKIELHYYRVRLLVVTLTAVFISQFLFSVYPTRAANHLSPIPQSSCQPITDGERLNETIRFAGDTDCFTFQGLAGDFITAFVDNKTGAGMYITLYKPNGAKLVSDESEVTWPQYIVRKDIAVRDQKLSEEGAYIIIIGG